MHRMVLFHEYVLKGLLIVLIQEFIASKSSKVNSNVEWNIDQYPNITETDHLTLTCKKSYQLLDIAVVAGTEILDEEDEDFKTVKVFGYTPSLVINTNMCYWNRACIISFPRDAMFSCVSVINSTDKGALIRPNEEFSQASCFLQNVEFLRPVHAKCVADKLVRNIFDRHSQVLSPTKLPRRKGLLKSHMSYPWNYLECYRNHTYRHRFKLRKERHVLLFGLKFVHVCDGDRLVLKTKKGDTNLAFLEENTHLNFTKKTHRYVELEFKISPYSDGCGGFLICYNVVKKKHLHTYGEGKKNVCDDLMKKIPKLDREFLTSKASGLR
ncbi:uncharacterized protein LOC132743629 [Ruditapes philippinarum]|uniref:uncharacterized protein LOC132743629 n=1 Tax=Ruditapes philippinarum TaxID=129788 RepID=UPI00295B0ECB|nr:uncharacterized protein LOC132743629 [Ruditapes philippinarum]